MHDIAISPGWEIRQKAGLSIQTWGVKKERLKSICLNPHEAQKCLSQISIFTINIWPFGLKFTQHSTRFMNPNDVIFWVARLSVKRLLTKLPGEAVPANRNSVAQVAFLPAGGQRLHCTTGYLRKLVKEPRPNVKSNMPLFIMNSETLFLGLTYFIWQS